MSLRLSFRQPLSVFVSPDVHGLQLRTTVH
jgi:hypothetical protein